MAASSGYGQLQINLVYRIIQIMTAQVRYITHPQVKKDPAIPVPSWGLSAVGKTRTETLAKAGKLSGTTQIIASGERKAIEAAEIIGGELQVAVEVREAMHENDRSATGFLPPDEFEVVANEFFAQPLVSIRGWERAIDAQRRVVREVQHVLARNRQGDLLFVGHGAVGTLLFCHYSGFAIGRDFDQPAGAVTTSRSSKRGDVCCIHGVGWRTYLASRCPLWVDIVAKVENRATRKISPKLIFSLLCRRVAFQRH